MKILAIVPLLVLAGCSTPKIAGYKEPELITRAEVIQASKDCINARMKPVIQHLPQKTEHGTVMLPIFVNCEPYNVR
jgi:hypothetical protein